MLTTDGAGFAELRRSVGAITDSVLSDRLSELAHAGLVERTVTDARPPGVSYRLTETGSALKPILGQLAGWASEHLPERCPTGRTGWLIPPCTPSTSAATRRLGGWARTTRSSSSSPDDIKEVRRRARAKWGGVGRPHVDAVQRLDRVDGYEVRLNAGEQAMRSS